MEAYDVDGYVYWNNYDMRCDGLFSDYISEQIDVEDYVYNSYNFRDFIRDVLEDEIDKDTLYDNALDECTDDFWENVFREGWDIDWGAYPPKVCEYGKDIELMIYAVSGMPN